MQAIFRTAFPVALEHRKKENGDKKITEKNDKRQS